MKTIKKLYSYYPSSGLEARQVDGCTSTSLVVRTGISGEVIRRTEIDSQGSHPLGRYFTTPIKAIEAYIAKAEAAIANPTLSRGDRSGWLKCLNAARDLLRREHGWN